jgi:hypothetical protein
MSLCKSFKLSTVPKALANQICSSLNLIKLVPKASMIKSLCHNLIC